MKYFSVEQVFQMLVKGEVKRNVIYTSMTNAKLYGYADREMMFKSALALYDMFIKNRRKLIND